MWVAIRKEKMVRLAALLLLSAIGCLPAQAAAFQDNAVQTLTEELKVHAPAKWDVRCESGDLFLQPPVRKTACGPPDRNTCLTYLRVVSELAPGDAPTVPGELFVMPEALLSPFLAD